MTTDDLSRNRENFCYRHPDRQSFVLCQRCLRTICPECQTPAAVGVICPECLRDQQKAQSPAQRKAERRWSRPRAVTASAGQPVVTYTIIALTAFVFLLSLIPFRAFTLTDAVTYFGHLFSSDGHRSLALGAIPTINELLCVLFVVLLHVLDLPAVRGTRERLLQMPAPLRGMAYGCVVVYLFLFVPIGASTFIYRQF